MLQYLISRNVLREAVTLDVIKETAIVLRKRRHVAIIGRGPQIERLTDARTQRIEKLTDARRRQTERLTVENETTMIGMMTIRMMTIRMMTIGMMMINAMVGRRSREGAYVGSTDRATPLSNRPPQRSDVEPSIPVERLGICPTAQ
ncbi:hypothetical protein [Ruegeria profundi]|uniref:hypothetical protein n=1 Tax=Ruegeria profundi TaxID=1685378 RepID=UPI001CD48F42|nr:hypothetical protein [Ruegeria profundi]MCA0928795.1 hypothetical protein [Ruegeria profundi]